MSVGRISTGRADARGTALIAVVVTMVGIGVLSMALLAVSSSAFKVQRQSKDETGALYAAEAGIADALYSLRNGGSGDLGSEDDHVNFGGTDYWVDTTDNGDRTFTLVGTGIEGRGGARIEVVVERNTSTFFQWGAFGKDYLHLDAQAKVDSYDSAAGTYAEQCIHGSGASAHAEEDGSTGSNGDITLDHNAKIFGDGMPGVDGSISILGNAEVHGSTAPMPETIETPPIELPTIAVTGTFDIAKNKTATIGPGEWHYTRLSANTGSTLRVTGPATVIFDSWTQFSGSRVTVDAANGPVEFYIQDSFVIHSNTTIASTTYKPADITFHLLSDNIRDPQELVTLDTVDFDSNSKLYGTVYAPNALINIESNFEFFGSLIARQIDLDSNCRIHFDEDLLNSEEEGGGGVAYTTICWRELPYRPRQGSSSFGD